MPPKIAPMTSQQEKFVRMEACGAKREDIFREVFGLELSELKDRNSIARVDNKMSRWRKHPDYRKIWDDQVRQDMRKLMGKSLRTVDEGLENKKLPWLQLQAANIALSHAKGLLMDDDKTVTVRVEGMPDIGTPDGENG